MQVDGVCVRYTWGLMRVHKVPSESSVVGECIGLEKGGVIEEFDGVFVACEDIGEF